MAALGMGDWGVPATKDRSVRVRRTTWVRARRSGIALLDVELGEKVERGQVMGTIGDALPSRASRITAPATGWVIAVTLDPLVGQGDALVHLALADDAVRVRIDRGPEPRSRARRRETDPH
jgi:predicted deacylase